MKQLDWIVLATTLLFIVLYGMWKGHGSRNIKSFLLADRSMKWYTVALAIMATQASAITFTSTPGQAYTDGMRFGAVLFWPADSDGNSLHNRRANFPQTRSVHSIRIS